MARRRTEPGGRRRRGAVGAGFAAGGAGHADPVNVKVTLRSKGSPRSSRRSGSRSRGTRRRGAPARSGHRSSAGPGSTCATSTRTRRSRCASTPIRVARTAASRRGSTVGCQRARRTARPIGTGRTPATGRKTSTGAGWSSYSSDARFGYVFTAFAGLALPHTDLAVRRWQAPRRHASLPRTGRAGLERALAHVPEHRRRDDVQRIAAWQADRTLGGKMKAGGARTCPGARHGSRGVADGASTGDARSSSRRATPSSPRQSARGLAARTSRQRDIGRPSSRSAQVLPACCLQRSGNRVARA